MNVVAHFRGGPLDGCQLAIADARARIEIVAAPLRETWLEPGDSEVPLLLPPPYVYERLAGVVAGEAVYEFVPPP